MRSMNRKQRSEATCTRCDTEPPCLLAFFTDLQSFREALSVLQRQVDELDELKLSHYQEIIEHEEEIWNAVQNKVRSHPPPLIQSDSITYVTSNLFSQVCVLVRSEMDVFDRVTAKA